jgi:hypothetical protein
MMSGIPIDNINVKKEFEREAVQDEEPDYTPILRELVPDDPKLYAAMEFFLLASPARQIAQLGDYASLKEKGDQARSSEDRLMARIDYESAAKVALYEQDRQAVEELLTLSEKVTAPGEHFGELHRTLLGEIDKAMRIARDYYARIQQSRPADVQVDMGSEPVHHVLDRTD